MGGFYPVTVNPELVEKMSDSLKRLRGRFYESNIRLERRFFLFSQEIPGVRLGVNKPGEGESANFGEGLMFLEIIPYFIVDDSALDEGVKALTYLVLTIRKMPVDSVYKIKH